MALGGADNLARSPELRTKLLWTLGLLCAYRIGGHIPVPGVDGGALAHFFESVAGTLFGLFDMFSGGGLRNVSVFALGIMPYISASIILQLLQVVSPELKRMAKEEGAAGRRKITQYTRYSTVLITIIQGFGIAVGLETMYSPGGVPVVLEPGWTFRIMTMLTLTAGTVLIMWLGEQITEKGIGNGISLIIFCGIVARFPEALQTIVQYLEVGTITPLQALLFAAIALAMIVVVIEVNEGQRRIPVQYAKRVIGRKMYGGHSTFLPLKVNQAGVIPIIFASSILMLPVTLAQFVHVGWVQALAKFFGWGTWANTCLYAILIVIFTYFYTAITVNVTELADNMKKYGGFIPGIRPGEPTMRYVDKVLTRITLTGSVFLAFIAILPNFIGSITNIQGVYFGGTALLIIVGVALDTMRQAQSLMVTRNYQGFIK